MKRSYLILGGVGLLAAAGALVLLHHAAQSPQRVFSDMLRNNLATPGVTRVVTQTGSGVSVNKFTQLNFGQQPNVHNITIIKQAGGVSTIEEINTPTADLVRYKNITTAKKGANGKPLDTASIVGKWAALDSADNPSGTVSKNLFDKTVIGLLPIANLAPSSRNELLSYIQENDIFSFDTKNVKHVTVNGRESYQYAVSIKPAPYIVLMQRFGKLVGVATPYDTLDPNDYSKANPIATTISASASGHSLTQIATNGSVESYQGFGISNTASLPRATLTTTELAKRFAEVLK